MKNGNLTKKTVIRERDRVQLHVVEFNKYIYRLKTEQKKVVNLDEELENTETKENPNTNELYETETISPGIRLDSIGSALIDIEMPDLHSYASDVEPDSNLTIKSLVKSRENLKKIESEIIILSNEIRRLSDILVLTSTSMVYLDEFLGTPYLPPSTIMALVRDHYAVIFGKGFLESAELGDALRGGVTLEYFRKQTALFWQLNVAWKAEKKNYDKLFSSLNSESQKSPEALSLMNSEKAFSKGILMFDASVKKFLSKLAIFSIEAPKVGTINLVELCERYIEITQTRFEYNETFIPDYVEMNLILRFSLKNGTDDHYRLKVIKINVNR
jgi:hypothetical protein